LFGLLALNFASRFLIPAHPTVELKLNRVDKLKKQYNSEADQAVVLFDLNADLTSIFNWNTKQLFVYVTAKYQTQQFQTNEVVIWDKLILDKQQAKFNLVAEVNKYLLADRSHGLRGNEVNLTFSWDITPISGMLQIASLGSSRTTFPAEYI